MNADAAVIEVRGLSKSFGARRAVDNFSLRVGRGRIVGFLGPNGSGKTTTIRMLCGLLKPDSGNGTCLGFDIIRDAQQIKRRVGYMTQRFGLYEDLSIRENLDFIGRIFAVSGRRGKVDAMLAQLGLTDRQHQVAGQLSGGWKQRLALAACLLHDPQLLLLDEPTAGVDPKARREFWDHIHALAAAGMTVLVSTHYMDEAERCHQLAYIAYGTLLAVGTAAEVVRDSGLTTWEVTGPDLPVLAAQLRTTPGIAMVVAFGTTLHVSGPDPQRLQAGLAGLRDDPRYGCARIEPGLEDVFIHLMQDTHERIVQ